METITTVTETQKIYIYQLISDWASSYFVTLEKDLTPEVIERIDFWNVSVNNECEYKLIDILKLQENRASATFSTNLDAVCVDKDICYQFKSVEEDTACPQIQYDFYVENQTN